MKKFLTLSCLFLAIVNEVVAYPNGPYPGQSQSLSSNAVYGIAVSAVQSNAVVNNNLTPVPQTFFGNLNGYWNGNTNGFFAFASVTNCLAGWWSWNGNLYNSIAQDNAFFVNINGYAAPAYVANGESLQALSPGVGGFKIVTTNNNAYDIGVFTNWTFSTWSYLTNSSGTMFYVGGTLNYWYFGYNGTAFILIKYDGSTLNFPSAMPVNQWVHVAVVVNLYNATVYTNGVALTPLPTGSPRTLGPDNTLLFGNSTAGIGNAGQTYGYVDECAYFTNCLTQPEIASIYYAGANSLNIGMAVIYTNSNFTINASGISLPTGHSFIGDGSGLTNLNVAGSTNLVASTFSLPNGTVIISSDGTVTSTNFQGNGSGLTNLTIPPSSSYISSMNGTATNLNVLNGTFGGSVKFAATNNNILVNNNLTPVPQTAFGGFNFLYNSNTNGYFAFASVTNCLVSWWPFSGNLNDVVGGNNGVVQGGVASYVVNGESMQAVSLIDAPSSVLTVSSSAYDINVFTNWSYSGWFFITNTGYDINFIREGHWALYYSTSGNGFAFGVSQGYKYFAAVLPMNQWVHVAVVADLELVTIYTNGIALTPVPIGDKLDSYDETTLTLSGLSYNGYGYMDEVAWFTNCLSAGEVASIYYAGANSLNIGESVISTNTGFSVIPLTGVSLPTGQTYYGNGAGLTNLNVTAESILTNGGNSGSAFYSIDPGVWGASSEAFGYDASAPGNFSFAAGEESAANGPASTVIGYSASVFLAGTNGVAIGSHALVTGPNGVAIGAGAATDVGIAIGEGVTVLGPQVVLGNANITNTILQGVVNGNGAGLTNLNVATNLNAPISPTNTWVFVGDSLTAGYEGTYMNYPKAFSAMAGCLATNFAFVGGSSTLITSNYLAMWTNTPSISNLPTIFMMGRNDATLPNDINYTNPSVTISNIWSCINVHAPSNYWVMSVLNATNEYPGGNGFSNYTGITNVNMQLATTFTNHYIDVYHFIHSHGNPAFPLDIWAASNDIPPVSLIAADGSVHYNDEGYLVMGIGAYAGVAGSSLFVPLSSNLVTRASLVEDLAGSPKLINANGIIFDGVELFQAQPLQNNYFFGGNAGNSTNTSLANTALGYGAMHGVSAGVNGNVAVGFNSMQNSAGVFSVGLGYNSLNSSSGTYDLGIGINSLYYNTGGYNVAIGASAMNYNVGGNYNVAIGHGAMGTNSNTGSGSVAAFNSVAVGANSMNQNSQSGDTAVGYNALVGNYSNEGYNTAIGYGANVSSDWSLNRTAIGYNAVNNVDNSVLLGGPSVVQVNVTGKLIASGYITSTNGFVGTQNTAAGFNWSLVPAYSATQTNVWFGVWTNGQMAIVYSNTSSSYVVKPMATYP